MGDTTTEENLMAAFINGSQTAMKYHAFATAADKEGCLGTARLFRAAAESKKFHAWTLRNAGEIGSVRENFQTAVDDGTEKFARAYPKMIAVTKKEGQDAAVTWFTHASKVEKAYVLICKKVI